MCRRCYEAEALPTLWESESLELESVGRNGKQIRVSTLYHTTHSAVEQGSFYIFLASPRG